MDDLQSNNDTIITIENDYIENQELLEDILLEKLKEEIENQNVEIIDFEPVNKQDNLYRFSYDDYYYYDSEEYQYKGDINNKAEKFMDKTMKEVLDIIKQYK
jgi:hypothetical protein